MLECDEGCNASSLGGPALRSHFALFSVTALVVAASVAQAADPILNKLSHVVAPDAPKGRGAIWLWADVLG